MGWHDGYDTSVDFTAAVLIPPLTPKKLADMIGLEPSQTVIAGDTVRYYRDPLPRQRTLKHPSRATTCTFNSRIFTESEAIIDHIKATLAFFEPRRDLLRRIAGQCHRCSFTIRLRHHKPAETSFDLQLLSRLARFDNDREINFTFDCGLREPADNEIEKEEEDKDNQFRLSYTLEQECGAASPLKKKKYRFDCAGADFILGMDECSYSVENDFRKMFVESIHEQRDNIKPLLADGYRGTFRIARDFESNFFWEWFYPPMLYKLRDVAERLVFAFE